MNLGLRISDGILPTTAGRRPSKGNVMTTVSRLERIGLVVLLASLASWFAAAAAVADPPALTNSIAVGNFTVSYPDGWSTFQSGRLTFIVNVTADKQATLGNQLVFTPQVNVSVEQRASQSDAASRLSGLAASAGAPVTNLTIGGSPAIQWRNTVPWPTAGGQGSASGMALTITTVIASGSQLVRLDGSMPSDAPTATADTIVAIETSVSFSPGPTAASASAASMMLMRQVRELGGSLMHWVRGFGRSLALQRASIAIADDDNEVDLTPPVGEAGDSTAASPGSATRIIISNTGQPISEPEVATSTDGRKIVVAQQFVWSWSNDGGQTFNFGGSFPNSTGGDSSLAVGQSGDFYEATIFNNTTAVHRSTDGGQTFTFRGTAFTCGSGQCGFTGVTIPDQEHIAADPTNAGDIVYSVFRDGFVPPKWGIACSTDGGATWTISNVGLAGDFPRVRVASDGSVYVAFVQGSSVMVDKFAGCSGSLSEVSGFPVTVASGVNSVTCPVPGLDRCNNGNDLRSPTVVPDDTNANHLFYAYATNTGSGNENILIQDSADGGSTWSSATTLNGGGTARRFMPWMCATQGTAYISWYDRRNATATGNDLTDYFGNSAARSGSSLSAGTEFQINDSSTSDAQCLGGKTVGSQQSWPGGSRATGDSTSCSEQPELAGVCGTGACGPGNSCPSGQTCDSTGICRNGAQQFCDFNTTTCANGGDTCQVWGGGVPKYGDYNGNACAVGHLYATWASATPPRATNAGIDLFFKVRDTVTPSAKCKDVTANTDPGVCQASGVNVDNGSSDPDNDTFTLMQTPPNPYPKGTTLVTNTITDQNGQTASCTANVTVIDAEKPKITCDNPVLECTSPAGAVVPNLIGSVSDNCGIQSKGCSPAEGSTFPIGTTPFTCTATDTSNNSNSCSSQVVVKDTTPPVIDSVSASPNTLWPPNHKFATVLVSASAHDTCDPSPTCAVTAVSSSEPPTGGGQGNTSPDFMFTTQFMTSPATLPVQLRAERDGTGNGRVYTITVNCKDASNNVSLPATTQVTVAHNQ